MPERDGVILYYLLTDPVRTGLGTTYTPVFQRRIWAEVVRVRTAPSNHQGADTFDELYKVRMLTPPEPFNLELTRFVWSQRDRTQTLQPYASEIVSGTRQEKSMYFCHRVEDLDVD